MTQAAAKKKTTINVLKSGAVRTVFFLDPELKRAIKIAAIERECSPSELVAEAVKSYLREKFGLQL
jgi:hypothetical protein